MVAYYEPGDTATSFYAMVGEQVYCLPDILLLSILLIDSCRRFHLQA